MLSLIPFLPYTPGSQHGGWHVWPGGWIWPVGSSLLTSDVVHSKLWLVVGS